MTDRCLVDTNVLIYSIDPTSGRKQLTASEIAHRLASSRRAVTTSQVVAEFYQNATRPRVPSPFMRPAQALSWLEEWMASSEWVDLTELISREAVRGAYQYQMGIFNAQMWAVARIHGIPFLLSEDLQSQPIIEGVRYINPFDATFDLADLGL